MTLAVAALLCGSHLRIEVAKMGLAHRHLSLEPNIFRGRNLPCQHVQEGRLAAAAAAAAKITAAEKTAAKKQEQQQQKGVAAVVAAKQDRRHSHNGGLTHGGGGWEG